MLCPIWVPMGMLVLRWDVVSCIVILRQQTVIGLLTNKNNGLKSIGRYFTVILRTSYQDSWLIWAYKGGLDHELCVTQTDGLLACIHFAHKQICFFCREEFPLTSWQICHKCTCPFGNGWRHANCLIACFALTTLLINSTTVVFT